MSLEEYLEQYDIPPLRKDNKLNLSNFRYGHADFVVIKDNLGCSHIQKFLDQLIIIEYKATLIEHLTFSIF